MQNYITLLKSFVLDRYTVQILENHSIFISFIIEILLLWILIWQNFVRIQNPFSFKRYGHYRRLQNRLCNTGSPTRAVLSSDRKIFWLAIFHPAFPKKLEQKYSISGIYLVKFCYNAYMNIWWRAENSTRVLDISDCSK